MMFPRRAGPPVVELVNTKRHPGRVAIPDWGSLHFSLQHSGFGCLLSVLLYIYPCWSLMILDKSKYPNTHKSWYHVCKHKTVDLVSGAHCISSVHRWVGESPLTICHSPAAPAQGQKGWEWLGDLYLIHTFIPSPCAGAAIGGPA